MSLTHEFPEGFLWGTATASYQIEGSPLADGASPSIWHRFAHTPGNIHENQNADVTCDHYRRYQEDVELMSDLSLNAYRFSIAWPRVIPEGTGKPNPKGLDFYSRLVDSLLDKNIRPFATLYHWDLPGALQDRGGWANRDSSQWFAEYAAAVIDHLGDRVLDWITLNEPMVSALAGYFGGFHAPGMRDLWAGLKAAQNLIRGHGLAVQSFRGSGATGEIGITLNLTPHYPASDSQEDVDATARMDAYINRMFLDPVMKGSYPEVLTRMLGDAWPEPLEEDMAIMAEPIDFLGVNYYVRAVVENAPGAGFLQAKSLPQEGKRTTMDWVVYPEGLHDILTSVNDEYCPRAMFVTENGASFPDTVGEDGSVDDPDRLDYLKEHFAAAHRAIAAGVPLKGYFVWTFIDNFEWNKGYSQWFGVVHMDPKTQDRTVKNSGRWFASVAESNGF